MGTLPTTDEYMHEPTDDPEFNESMYFNFVDSGSGFAVLIRMGNRVNEGHAETTVLVYLPDGGAAIHFERAPIATNDKFDAGGLRFDVIDPLEHMRVTYSGDANRLTKGTDLADPKSALGTSPVVPLEVALEYRSLIPLYGLTADGTSGMDGADSAIATGHYQGPCRVTGTVTVDGEVREVTGLGFRDHSWGPRRWQGPTYWRWISCLCDDDNGFVAWVTKIGGERVPGNGMALRDGKFALVNKVDISSTYGEAPHYPETLDVTLHTEGGASLRARGETFHNVPLRHRRDGNVARLAEIVVKYDFDGVEGYGISEYHDLIIDGVPAGVDEA